MSSKLFSEPELLFDSESLSAGQDSQFETARNPEFSVDVAQVPLHGLFADGQLAGNLPIAVAFFDCGDDFNFSRSESKVGCRLTAAAPARNRLAADPELSLKYRTYAFQQKLRRRGLKHDATSAQL